MHRIIEQTAISCGMVKTPNPSSHERDGRPDAEYHHSFLLSQGSHPRDETPKAAEQETEDAHSAARR
jgi:hypothetical protein